MDFQPVRPGDFDALKPYLKYSRFIDMGFSSLYSLKESYFPEYGIYRDMLVIRMLYGGSYAYAHPLKAVLRKEDIVGLVDETGSDSIIFDYIPEECVPLYADIPGYSSEIMSFDKYSDYFADAASFTDLNRTGHPRKYTDYRSFTTHFSADVRQISRDNIADCKLLLDKWCSARDCSLCAYGCEKKLQHVLFDDWENLPVSGIIVYIDGAAQSYLIGEQNGETALILYGKPVGGQNGLNVFTHIELIRRCFHGAKYVNYSPNSGMDGLKLFKRKFTPFKKLSKHYCTLSKIPRG